MAYAPWDLGSMISSASKQCKVEMFSTLMILSIVTPESGWLIPTAKYVWIPSTERPKNLLLSLILTFVKFIVLLKLVSLTEYLCLIVMWSLGTGVSKKRLNPIINKDVTIKHIFEVNSDSLPNTNRDDWRQRSLSTNRAWGSRTWGENQ